MSSVNARRIVHIGVLAAFLCLGGCASETYYEITDKRTGEVTFATERPRAEAAAAPDIPGARGLVGRNTGRGVSQQYIVREITRREYQQRTAASPASEPR